jgi:hypothetical protein
MEYQCWGWRGRRRSQALISLEPSSWLKLWGYSFITWVSLMMQSHEVKVLAIGHDLCYTEVFGYWSLVLQYGVMCSEIVVDTWEPNWPCTHTPYHMSKGSCKLYRFVNWGSLAFVDYKGVPSC